MNIGGLFDVYVSKFASSALRRAVLPSLAVTGQTGGAFVIRLRFGDGTDYGRNRYLLLLMERNAGQGERERLVGLLETRLAGQFDRLAVAVNRDEVTKDLRQIYRYCEELDGEQEPSELLETQPAQERPATSAQATGDGETGGPDKQVDSDGPTAQESPGGGDSGLGRAQRRRLSGSVAAVMVAMLAIGVAVGSSPWYLSLRQAPSDTGSGYGHLEVQVAGMKQELQDAKQLLSEGLSDVRSRLVKLEARSRNVEALAIKLKNQVTSIGKATGTIQTKLSQIDAMLPRALRTAGRRTPIDKGGLPKQGQQTDWKATSEDVRRVQEKLKEHGFYIGAVDGDIGPRTAQAIKDFLARMGRNSTGRLDFQTFLLIVGGESGGN